MTDREKAIVMAYTGCTMLAGDKLDIFYQYVKEKLGRSVMTHELAYEEVQDAIKEAAKEDFIAIAKADNGWISVKDRLPAIGSRVLVYSKFGHVSDMTLQRHGGQNGYDVLIFDPHGMKPGTDITHWTELPERPKK